MRVLVVPHEDYDDDETELGRTKHPYELFVVSMALWGSDAHTMETRRVNERRFRSSLQTAERSRRHRHLIPHAERDSVVTFTTTGHR